MAKLTKKQKQIREIVEFGKVYPIAEAIEVLKQLPKAKFLESIDVSVNLGIDPRKSDQVVRGATIMPHGTGQEVRVAVFAQGPNAEAAKAAGADVVGFEDLAESIKAGNLDFDVVIATPDAMRIVGQLGQILGPRGLMPNPRVGTVTPDVATAVANEKSGQVRFRADKAGILHCSIGKIDFESNQIHENLGALLAEVRRLKPASSKGIYVQKVTISTTMGPGLSVDVATI